MLFPLLTNSYVCGHYLRTLTCVGTDTYLFKEVRGMYGYRGELSTSQFLTPYIPAAKATRRVAFIHGLEIRLRVQGSGFRVQGSGFRVQGSGFRVQGLG